MITEADLDFSRAWHGHRDDPRCLASPHPRSSPLQGFQHWEDCDGCEPVLIERKLKNWWKKGVPRSVEARQKQSAAMHAYYAAKGLSMAPGPVRMRELRAEKKAQKAA